MSGKKDKTPINLIGSKSRKKATVKAKRRSKPARKQQKGRSTSRRGGR
jgi:hypothetical protein